MIDGYKIVCCTPAGRRRYLEVLSPYVEWAMDKGIVDRWDIWANTTDADDMKYLESMCFLGMARFIEAGNLDIGNIGNIRNFYPFATDPGTIYIRLDDDIVWLAEDFWTELVECRLEKENVNKFLVSANVVNNCLCDWIHQRNGRLPVLKVPLTYNCMCRVGWESGEHAEHVHREFLNDLANNRGREWAFKDWDLLDSERFSINAVAFFGKDMAEIVKNGGVGQDEESWLTQAYPMLTGRHNIICGTALASHFAFHPQREYLDKTDILERYRELSCKLFSPVTAKT